VSRLAVPACDPVTEVFDAIVQARRARPETRGEWKVAVRSRTGQLLAAFMLGSREQLLDFAERVEPLGYRMNRIEWDGDHSYEFSFDRRAANEAIDPPRRRQGE
jgi:hypothetical protein